MALISGIDVILHIKKQIGADAFGAPIYEDSTKTVNNVIVGSPSSEDAVNELNLTGKHIVYTLCIPKGNEDIWDNTEVEFFGRKFRTVGYAREYIDKLVPLDWNKQINVEAYEQ